MNWPPAVFPSRPDLSGWRRQSATTHPDAIWLGHVRLYRVEAPVWVDSLQPFGPVRQQLLSWLAAHPDATLSSISDQLSLVFPIAEHWLRDLARQGSVDEHVLGKWRVSPGASDARKATLTHRVFHFAVREVEETPHYVPLLADVGEPMITTGEALFQPQWLEASCARSAAWKTEWHFPHDVRPVFRDDANVAEWQRVSIVRLERLALLLTAPTWQAWAVDARIGALRHGEPVLTLAGEEQARTLFGAGVATPSEHGWRTAWTEWARAHGLATPEANACQLRYEHGMLHVSSLLSPDRWRSFQRGREEWLYAGSGAWRCAARLLLPH